MNDIDGTNFQMNQSKKWVAATTRCGFPGTRSRQLRHFTPTPGQPQKLSGPPAMTTKRVVTADFADERRWDSELLIRSAIRPLHLRNLRHLRSSIFGYLERQQLIQPAHSCPSLALRVSVRKASTSCRCHTRVAGLNRVSSFQVSEDLDPQMTQICADEES